MGFTCDTCCSEAKKPVCHCFTCDGGFCQECDIKIHSDRGGRKHERVLLGQEQLNEVMCDICQEQQAVLFCQEDRAVTCRQCDLMIHTANQFTAKHHRFIINNVYAGLRPLPPAGEGYAEEASDPGSDDYSASLGTTPVVEDKGKGPRQPVTRQQAVQRQRLQQQGQGGTSAPAAQAAQQPAKAPQQPLQQAAAQAPAGRRRAKRKAVDEDSDGTWPLMAGDASRRSSGAASDLMAVGGRLPGLDTMGSGPTGVSLLPSSAADLPVPGNHHRVPLKSPFGANGAQDTAAGSSTGPSGHDLPSASAVDTSYGRGSAAAAAAAAPSGLGWWPSNSMTQAAEVLGMPELQGFTAKDIDEYSADPQLFLDTDADLSSLLVPDIFPSSQGNDPFAVADAQQLVPGPGRRQAPWMHNSHGASTSKAPDDGFVPQLPQQNW